MCPLIPLSPFSPVARPEPPPPARSAPGPRAEPGWKEAMWIVRLALSRPSTFVVGALVLLLLTPFVLQRTPTDIFPAINIPVISVVWQYAGLNATEIEQRLVYL